MLSIQSASYLSVAMDIFVCHNILMKKIFFGLLFLVAAFSAKSQYLVTLHTPNYKSGMAYLTYYSGKSINIEDSAMIGSKGIAVFTKKQKLQPGIYSIVFPGKNKMVDFFVDKEQVITIKADTTDLLNKTIVTGSKENVLFQQYQKFVIVKGSQMQAERNAYNISKTKADSLLHEKNYAGYNNELAAYRAKVVKESPQSMLAVLFKSMNEPAIPIARPATKQDSTYNYNIYKKNYWDGISFMDDRIIRTPFFLPKVEKYFREILVPSSDTIIKEADYLLLLARSNKEMYQFLLNWLTDEYIYPKYMGQDAVFVHLFEKYHSKGISYWLNEKQITAVTNRAYMLMSNLIGEKAANLEMVDSSGKAANLYDVKSEFIIVAFWDPTCSHCQQEIPRLDSFYQSKWKNQGVKIYGVLTENENAKWKEFINKNNLKEWIHVYETNEKKNEIIAMKKPGYKQLYDITQTPVLYLLDKEKRIIAKKLTLQQMEEVLQAKIKNKQVN